MNKTSFINELALRCDLNKKKSQEITNAMILIITQEMQSESSISFAGFGSFKPVNQHARLARNPKTGEPVMIKERRSVKFKPGSYLLNDMNSRE